MFRSFLADFERFSLMPSSAAKFRQSSSLAQTRSPLQCVVAQRGAAWRNSPAASENERARKNATNFVLLERATYDPNVESGRSRVLPRKRSKLPYLQRWRGFARGGTALGSSRRVA